MLMTSISGALGTNSKPFHGRNRLHSMRVPYSRGNGWPDPFLWLLIRWG